MIFYIAFDISDSHAVAPGQEADQLSILFFQIRILKQIRILAAGQYADSKFMGEAGMMLPQEFTDDPLVVIGVSV